MITPVFIDRNTEDINHKFHSLYTVVNPHRQSAYIENEVIFMVCFQNSKLLQKVYDKETIERETK